MEITSYQVLGRLPDLFTFRDGRKVLSPSDWAERRNEIRDAIIGAEYGILPAAPEFMDIAPLSLRTVPGEMSIYRITTGTRAKPASFTVYVHLPKGEGPHPIVIDGDLCYACMQDPDIARKFVDKGIMLAVFNRCEIVPDVRNPSRTGNLYETYAEYSFGAIAAWAWGYSRTLDALEKLGLGDMSCVTFTGLSRGGKSAMLAGALDERASIINPEGSGCCGSACHRLRVNITEEDGADMRSERLGDILANFPDWFAPTLSQYIDREADMPFDQHFLTALLAPRVYFDSQARSDAWASPVNTWMAASAAGEVWRMYGKEENVLMYWRSGRHGHLPEDFDMLIEVIEREYRGKSLSDKFMNIPFELPEPIFDRYEGKCND